MRRLPHLRNHRQNRISAKRTANPAVPESAAEQVQIAEQVQVAEQEQAAREKPAEQAAERAVRNTAVSADRF